MCLDWWDDLNGGHLRTFAGGLCRFCLVGTRAGSGILMSVLLTAVDTVR